MKKKLAVIGRGTAGAVNAAHFLKHTKDEIDWYFDPNIPTQAVGEGSTLVLPNNLRQTIDFTYNDLKNIGGNYKYAIRKYNWGKHNHDFNHWFHPPHIAMHFDAIALQKLIHDRIKDNPRLKIHNQHVNSHDDIDADYIIDCSGRPENYEDFHICKFIPVNAVYVTQCYWDKPEFEYTVTMARKHGWVFGIPLQKRCSIGYLYNPQTSSLDEVKKDINHVFKELKLTPSDKTNAFQFQNYFKKENFTKRVAYNGNASFFLEPLEATSFVFVNQCARLVYDHLYDNMSLDECNFHYFQAISQTELMISMHYSQGSKFNTKFWKMAKEKGQSALVMLRNSPLFQKCLKDVIEYEENKILKHIRVEVNNFGTWDAYSWWQNLMDLGINTKDLLSE